MTRAPYASRWTALSLVACLAFPTIALTAGCGHGGSADNSQAAGGGSAPAMQPNTAPMNNPMNAPMSGQAAPKPGLSTKQKVVLLAGAALLFYLYKRYKSQDAAATANGGAQPQLYREERGPNTGAIYYHKNDPNHTVVWLSAPSQGMQVPADQVQQYLPGYNGNSSAYQSQVNTNPQPGVNGGQVQPADQYAGAAAGGQ